MSRKYPAVLILTAAVVGIVSADLSNLSSYFYLIAGLVLFLFGLWRYGRRDRLGTGVLVWVALTALAAFNFSLRFVAGGPNDLAQLLTDPIICRVYGRVADWPDLRTGRTEFEIDVDSLRPDGCTGARFVNGAVLLKVSDTTTALQRGDRISFRTRLYPLPKDRRNGFDYGRYLRLNGIGGQAYLTTLLPVELIRRPSFGYDAVVDRLRGIITSSLDRNLSESPAALAKGFLIGETRDIPPDIYRMFRDSGTLHLLAVSGSNVALVLIFFVWLLRPFGFSPTVRSLVLLGVVVLFAGLSYGDPSVVRASVMASLVLGARLLGRRIDLNNIIAATALVILIFDPAQLFDVGFQLSFATAWGLIFISPKVTILFGGARKKPWFRWLVLPLIVTIVAQVCSAPIIAYYFGRLSLIGPPANLVVVPMVSIAVLGVMIILLANLVWPLLGLWIGSVMDLWFRAVVGLLHLAGGDSMPVWVFGDALRSVPGLFLIGTTYLPLILVALAINSRRARRGLVIGVVVVADLALGVTLFGSNRERTPSLECVTVPGGVALVAQYGRGKNADLYISSLQNRSYQVDSSVIMPILSARGIERLERLVVLEADYGVVDALLRLSEAYAVEQPLYSSRLRPIVRDRMDRRSSGRGAAPQFFGSDPTAPEGEGGVYLSERQVCVDNGREAVVLTDRIRRDHFRTRPRPGVLVVGSTWSPAAADWLELSRAGWSRVVCAKFEHDRAEDWPDDELRAEVSPPDYVVDLAENGPFPIVLDR